MSKQPTVADYVVRRLGREGIADCFGVAGDFAFKLCDAVARSESVRWIGCSNELDAAYAADGYARVRGCSMLMTTYAVGELSALNGLMGAKAERSCVFHIVGMPTMRHQRVRKVIHHTLGDGEFQNFANISARAACVSAVITPDNCAHEMERLIATARAESRPAYILVAAKWQKVQELLQRHRHKGSAERNGSGAILKGLLYCRPCGSAMSPTYSSKGNKRYRYYICSNVQKRGWDYCPHNPFPRVRWSGSWWSRSRKWARIPSASTRFLWRLPSKAS